MNRRIPSPFSISKIHSYPILTPLSYQGLDMSQSQDEVTLPIQRFMYFVIPPGKTAESCLGQRLGELFQTAEAHFLNVEWIRDEDYKDTLLECDGNVLVFDSFDSPGFNFWEKHVATGPFTVEILGAPILRYIFGSSDVFEFQTKSVPTYTITMRGMVISLSGFTEPEKTELENKVKWMNGSISPNLTRTVTHLVTATAWTEKSIRAHLAKVQVMTAEWIREVWKGSQHRPINASHDIYSKYVCPTFYNVNVCLSGLSLDEKYKLKEAIDGHGGKCHADMVRGTIDILIASTPMGDKYKRANKWKVACLSPEWIERSAKQGHLLHPALFAVNPFVSRPMIQGSSPIPAPIKQEGIRTIDTQKCGDILQPSRMAINDPNETNTTLLECPPPDILEQIKAVKETHYLLGIRLFVDDHDNQHPDLQRFIYKSGATRQIELGRRKGVTHVIVPGKIISKSTQQKLQEVCGPVPALVTVEWLLQSAQQGGPADVEKFPFIGEGVSNASSQVMESNVAGVSTTKTHFMESVGLAEGSPIDQNNNDVASVEPTTSNAAKTVAPNVAGGSTTKPEPGTMEPKGLAAEIQTDQHNNDVATLEPTTLNGTQTATPNIAGVSPIKTDTMESVGLVAAACQTDQNNNDEASVEPTTSNGAKTGAPNVAEVSTTKTDTMESIELAAAACQTDQNNNDEASVESTTSSGTQTASPKPKPKRKIKITFKFV